MVKNGKIFAAALSIAVSAFCSCGKGTEVEERSTLMLNQSRLVLQVGESAVLVAELKHTDANPPLYWRSGDRAVATVDENGLVVAVAEGETTVSVQTKENTASCKIIVISEKNP